MTLVHRHRLLSAISYALLAVSLGTSAQAALRAEQAIYPGGGWEFANTGTRDTTVLPTDGWSSTDPLYPNLYWMRLNLSLPADWASKRVFARVGACAHHVKIYLNGSYAGERFCPAVPYEVDITPYINWSGSNVLMIGVQDYSAYLNLSDKSNNGLDYGAAPDPSLQGPMPFAVWMYYPRLWTSDIKLIARPKVRVADVFVKPSVRSWKLDVDLTLRNDDTVSHTVSIEDFVTKWNDPAVVKTFTPSSVTLGPGETKTTTVTVPWTDPILWTPNSPQLYTLKTTLKEGSTALDELSTRFGFREFWVQKSADNTRSWFVLNGARQNLRGEGVWHANLGDAYVNTYLDWLKSNNFNCVRFCSTGRESYYDTADEKGIMVESELPFNFYQKYTYDSTFWSRSQEMMLDMVKWLKNHPSIMLWGVENEVMLCSPDKPIGDDLLNIETTVRALDPTRAVMHEGDGDLRTTSKGVDSPGKGVQVVNIHNYDLAQPSRNTMYIMDLPMAAYVFGETTDATILPGYAYGTVMPDKSKPWYIGEFGPGAVLGNPQYLSFLNADDSYKDIFGQATGLMTAMGMNYAFQIDGYRYFDWICGIAPWATYSGDPAIGDGPEIAKAFKPVTTRIKEHTHNFFAGDAVTRTLTVYNDDVTSTSNFNLHWKLVNGADVLLSGDLNFVSQPGFYHREPLSFTAPSVTRRTYATLVLELKRNGTLADNTTQDMSIFPTRTNLSVPSGLNVYVYDPNAPNYSCIPEALTAAGVTYTRLTSPNLSGKAVGLLFLGHGAYPSGGFSGSQLDALKAWIRNGGTVVVYSDQWTAPHWLSISGDPTYGIQDCWYDMTIGFIRAPSHSILAGLHPDDCKFWAATNPTYNHYITWTDTPVSTSGGTWFKPSSGLMNVLVETGGRNQGMGDSPLCEYPDGKGSTIVCRLRFMERLTQEPAARTMAQNLLNYAAMAVGKAAPRGFGVLAGSGSQTPTGLDRAKLSYTSLKGQLSSYTSDALSSAFSLIMLDNDAEVWDEVDANRAKLQTFVSSGGKIMLRKLDAGRVAQANALTGVSMSTKATQLRHPQMEKKTSDIIMDGISADDVWWVYTGDEGADWYRKQKWASAIVSDVVSVGESAGVKGLLVEPNRTGTLQPDSGQSYALGDVTRDRGTAVSDPGLGLVRINSGLGFYLVDQVLWDASLTTQLNQKAQRYLCTLVTHCLDTLPPPAPDTVAPTVTINQAIGQADPTEASPIYFTVVFSEPVTDFTTGDVALSGSAGATTATVTGSGTTYGVAVSGMTSIGTVIASIAAAAAHDAAGNPNVASTSTDHTVTFNIPGAAPTNVSVNPAFGTLTTVATTFQCVYRDTDGYTDIRKAYLMINDSLGQSNAALVMYDRLANRLYLKNDANTSWGTGYAPGTNNTLENTQCSLFAKDTTFSHGGTDLTVNWRIAVKSPFAEKPLNGYMYVQDAGGLTDGWEQMGLYYNVKPQVVSIDPAGPPMEALVTKTLTSVYRDPNGAADIRKCYLLLNDTTLQSGAMLLWYDCAANKIYLKNTANTSWGTGYAPGTNITLSNNQCLVYAKDTTVTKSGTDVTIVWSFQVKSAFSQKNLYSYMYSADSKGLYDGWKKMGTHFTPLAPVCVSVTPSAGKVTTGVPLVFNTVYSDGNGYNNIWQCYLQIGQTGSLANTICVLYDAQQNKVFLRDDGHTTWGTGYAPGTNVILQNSQCSVSVKDTVITPSGTNDLMVDWKITVKASQIGKLLGERTYCRDDEWLNSTWKIKGYVRGQ